MRWVPLLLLLSALACAEGREVPEPLAAGGEGQARVIVERFFSAYVAADAEKAVELLCERDAASRARAAAFINSSQAEGSRFRVQAFEVRSVTAAWDGTQPLFQVQVAFPRNTSEGEMVHDYRVRAKDACIDRFLGEPTPRRPAVPPPPAASPPASPAAPPAAAPPSAPVDPGDEVIEL